MKRRQNKGLQDFNPSKLQQECVVQYYFLRLDAVLPVQVLQKVLPASKVWKFLCVYLFVVEYYIFWLTP